MEDFDNIFKKTFHDEKSAVSSSEEAGLWDSIVEDLGPEHSVEAKRGGLSTFWIVGIIAMILIPSAYLIGHFHGESNSVPTISAQDQAMDKTEIVHEINGELIQQDSKGKENDGTSVQNDKNDPSSFSTATGSYVDQEQAKNSVGQSKNNMGTYVQRQSVPSSVVTEQVEQVFLSQENSEKENTGAYAQNQKDLQSSSSTYTVNTIAYQEQTKSSEEQSKNKNNHGTFVQKEKKSSIPEKKEEVKRVDYRENSVHQEESNLAEALAVVEKEPTTTEYESNNGHLNISDENSDISASEEPISVVVSERISEIKEQQVASYSAREEVAINRLDPYAWSMMENNTKFDIPILSAVESTSEKLFGIQAGIKAGAFYSAITYAGGEQVVREGKNTTERGYFGEAVGLQFLVDYKSKWLFETGFTAENQRTIYNNEFFNAVLTEPRNTGILFNKAQGIVEDVYTTDSTEIRQSYNRIQQINTFRSYNIPITVGIQQHYRRITYGILGGVDIRIRGKQEGLVLGENNELVNLENTTDAFFNAMNIGYKVQPFVAYRLTDKIGLRVDYSARLYQPMIFNNGSLSAFHTVQGLQVSISTSLR